MVIPLPGGFLNSYSTTTFKLPAARKVAALALGFELMIWLSILGGIAVTVLLLNSGGDHSTHALRFLIGGLVAALGFRVARWLVLRRVRIGNAWNGFIEMGFDSETFAKEFSELNRLALGPV